MNEYEKIDIGGFDDDPAADDIRVGFSKVNDLVEGFNSSFVLWKSGEYFDEDKGPFFRVYKGVLYCYISDLPTTTVVGDFPNSSSRWSKMGFVGVSSNGKIKESFIPQLPISRITSLQASLDAKLSVKSNLFENSNVLVFGNVLGNTYNKSRPNNGDFLLSKTDEVINGKVVVYSVGNSVPKFITDRSIEHIGSFVSDNISINKIEIVYTEKGYVVEYEKIEGFNPLTLNPLLYIKANNGVSLSGSNVTVVNDLTGNNNDFTGVGNISLVEEGINGKPSLVFDGTSHLILPNPISGLTDLSKVLVWAVFQLTDVNSSRNYHSIFALGMGSYSVGGTNALQLYALNGVDEIHTNFNNNSLDDKVGKPQLEAHSVLISKTSASSSLSVDGLPFSVKTSTANVDNTSVVIGGFAQDNAKMMLSEFMILDNDTNTLTAQNIIDLNKYAKQCYNINQKPQVSVFNQGGNGNNTQNIIDRLTAIKADNPDVAILMIGTNDWRHPTPSQRLTSAQFKTNLLTIVDDLIANKIDVILVSFPPILNENAFYDYVCTAYGENLGCDVNLTALPFLAKINEVVAERNLKFIDMNQKFKDVNQPTALIDSFIQNIANVGHRDGVHLTSLGAEFVAQVISEFIFINGLKYERISAVGDSITEGNGLASKDKYPYKLYTKLN